MTPKFRILVDEGVTIEFPMLRETSSTCDKLFLEAATKNSVFSAFSFNLFAMHDVSKSKAFSFSPGTVGLMSTYNCVSLAYIW